MLFFRVFERVFGVDEGVTLCCYDYYCDDDYYGYWVFLILDDLLSGRFKVLTVWDACCSSSAESLLLVSFAFPFCFFAFAPSPLTILLLNYQLSQQLFSLLLLFIFLSSKKDLSRCLNTIYLLLVLLWRYYLSLSLCLCLFISLLDLVF